ncbi:MAG: alpha/beta hydrolase, partial [Vicinamibacteria bacterium]
CGEDPRGSPEASAETRTFTSEDGVELHASLFTEGGERAPSVVLLHGLGGDRSGWKFMANSLEANGFCALAIDFRGHGESTTRSDGGSLDWRRFEAGDYRAMTLDVKAAVEQLRKEPSCDAERLGLLGASLGANIALVYAASAVDVRSVALLSPGRNYRGVEIGSTVSGIDGRPVFLAAARADGGGYSARTVEDLAANLGGAVRTRIEEGDSHGVNLIGALRDLDRDLVRWFEETL